MLDLFAPHTKTGPGKGIQSGYTRNSEFLFKVQGLLSRALVETSSPDESFVPKAAVPSLQLGTDHPPHQPLATHKYHAVPLSNRTRSYQSEKRRRHLLLLRELHDFSLVLAFVPTEEPSRMRLLQVVDPTIRQLSLPEKLIPLTDSKKLVIAGQTQSFCLLWLLDVWWSHRRLLLKTLGGRGDSRDCLSSLVAISWLWPLTSGHIS